MAQTQEALELLLESGRLLSSTLDLPELLRTVLSLASRVVGAETASVLLLDEKTRELYFEQALGLGEAASRVRLKLGEGIAGTVAQKLKPEIINDAKNDPRWSSLIDAASGFRTRSILAVPMLIKGRTLGVVEAINKRGGAFNSDDLNTLEGFAAQAAVAIENARLFSSLSEERFKLSTIFADMSDAALLADAQGSVLLANAAARQLLGLAEGPSTLDEAFEPLVVTPPLPSLFSSGRTDIAFEAVREKPTRLILAGRATPIKVGWLLVFRDVSEARRKEGLKRTFLSLISHKLRTPLASILGYSEILVSTLGARKPATELELKAAEAIEQQGRKLTDLVDKLLRYTTLEDKDATLELRPCSMDGTIAEALRRMKEWLAKRGAEVSHEPAREPLTVFGDEKQLVEVVKNLIENAVKFNDKPRKRVAVWAEKAGDLALLRVKDEGCGIPPEEQQRIFSRFHQIETYFTGQVDGWGLGLSYVKKVVEGHSGQVELCSSLGKGTLVTVRLPLRNTRQQAPA